MTFEQFAPIFATLAIQLRANDADVGTARGYFSALKDLEPELVALSAERLGQSALNDQGEAWFPKVPEWRALAIRIEREREEALRARLRQLPTPLCQACEDTGWRDAGTEGRRVRRCECQDLRRLEVLGRRPMPQLASGEPV